MTSLVISLYMCQPGPCFQWTYLLSTLGHNFYAIHRIEKIRPDSLRGEKSVMIRQGQHHYNHNYNKAALTDPSNKGRVGGKVCVIFYIRN